MTLAVPKAPYISLARCLAFKSVPIKPESIGGIGGDGCRHASGD